MWPSALSAPGSGVLGAGVVSSSGFPVLNSLSHPFSQPQSLAPAEEAQDFGPGLWVPIPSGSAPACEASGTPPASKSHVSRFPELGTLLNLPRARREVLLPTCNSDVSTGWGLRDSLVCPVFGGPREMCPRSRGCS